MFSIRLQTKRRASICSDRIHEVSIPPDYRNKLELFILRCLLPRDPDYDIVKAQVARGLDR